MEGDDRGDEKNQEGEGEDEASKKERTGMLSLNERSVTMRCIEVVMKWIDNGWDGWRAVLLCSSALSIPAILKKVQGGGSDSAVDHFDLLPDTKRIDRYGTEGLSFVCWVPVSAPLSRTLSSHHQ